MNISHSSRMIVWGKLQWAVLGVCCSCLCSRQMLKSWWKLETYYFRNYAVWTICPSCMRMLFSEPVSWWWHLDKIAGYHCGGSGGDQIDRKWRNRFTRLCWTGVFTTAAMRPTGRMWMTMKGTNILTIGHSGSHLHTIGRKFYTTQCIFWNERRHCPENKHT